MLTVCDPREQTEGTGHENHHRKDHNMKRQTTDPNSRSKKQTPKANRRGSGAVPHHPHNLYAVGLGYQFGKRPSVPYLYPEVPIYVFPAEPPEYSPTHTPSLLVHSPVRGKLGKFEALSFWNIPVESPGLVTMQTINTIVIISKRTERLAQRKGIKLT
eukprot:549092-Rhodomonas_salina.1